MLTIHPQYITNNTGKKVSVEFPMKEFKTLSEEMEEMDIFIEELQKLSIFLI